MRKLAPIVQVIYYIIAFAPCLSFGQSVESEQQKDVTDNSHTISNIYENAERMEFDRFCSVMIAHAYFDKMSTDISVEDIINAEYHDLDSLDTAFLNVLKNEASRITLINKGSSGVDLWIGDTLACDAFPPFECDSSLSIVAAWYDPYDIGRNIFAAFDTYKEVDVPYDTHWQFVNDIDSVLSKNIADYDKKFQCRHIHHLFEYRRSAGLKKICSCGKEINHIDSLSISKVCDKYCHLHGYERISFDTYLSQGDGIFASKGLFSDINKITTPLYVCNGLVVQSLGKSHNNHNAEIIKTLGLTPNSQIFGYIMLDHKYMVLTGSLSNLSVHVVDRGGNKVSQLDIDSDSYFINKDGMIYVLHGARYDRYVVTPEGNIIKQNSLH